MKELLPIVIATVAAQSWAAAGTASVYQGSLDAPNPDTAINWNYAANWDNGVPNTGMYAAGLPVLTSAPAFILLPDELTVGGIGTQGNDSNKSWYLLGEKLIMNGQFTSPWPTVFGNGVAAGRICNSTTFPWVYANVEATGSNGLSGKWIIAGTITNTVGDTTLSVGDEKWRGDCYANSADPNRGTEVMLKLWNFSSSDAYLYFPRAQMEEATKDFTVADGSATISWTDSRAVTAGAPVSGEGIAAGTYVKRVFPELKMAQLSQPVSGVNGTSAITFGVYVPSSTVHLATLKRNGASGSRALHIVKQQAAVNAKIEVEKFTDGESGRVNRFMRLTSDTSAPTLLEIDDASGVKGGVKIDNVNLSLIGAGFENLTFFRFTENMQSDIDISVPAAGAAVITNMLSTAANQGFNKVGAGELTIYPAQADTERSLPSGEDMQGRVTASEGALKYNLDALEVTFKNVEVASGASIAFENGVANITKLTGVEGASVQAAEGTVVNVGEISGKVTLVGPGKFVLAIASDINKINATEGAIISMAVAGSEADIIPYGAVTGAVVGEPAFWVDAGVNVDTYTTTNNTIGVACWRDCREGHNEYYATNDFTGITTTYGWTPSTVMYYGANNTLPYIRHEGDLKFAVNGANGGNYRFVYSGMPWNKPITNICAVFAVEVGQYGAQAILGSTQRFKDIMGTAATVGDFRRGAVSTEDGGGIGTPTKAYLLSPKAAAKVRNGLIYIDNVAHAPGDIYNEAGLHVWEIHPTEGAAADAFAMQDCAGISTSGMQKQCEVIIYTNKLTQVERRQVCQYLMQKWLNKSIPTSIRDQRFLGNSAAKAFAGEFGYEVAEGALMGITALQNASTLNKSGAGKMYVDNTSGANINVQEGEVVVTSRELTAADIPTGAFIHLDANDADHMEITSRAYPDGVTRDEVTYWYDSDGGSILAQRRNTDPKYRGPYLTHPAALNGLAMVDYSILTNISPAAHSGEGTDYYSYGLFHDFTSAKSTGTMAYANSSSLGSLFMVVGSRNGGGVILGGYDNSQFKALRTPSKNVGDMIFTDAALKGTGYVNGERKDLTQTALSGGYDVISFLPTTVLERKFQSLMMCQQRVFTGGGEIGELILFENTLNQYNHEVVDAYLNYKWFGRTISGFAPSSVGTLKVAAGATLTVDGGSPLAVEALEAAGTINGSLTMAANANLYATVNTDGTITPATITGTANFAGGSITLVGTLNALRPGRYTLLTADGLTSGEWSVIRPAGKSQYIMTVSVVGNSIVLSVRDPASVIFLR